VCRTRKDGGIIAPRGIRKEEKVQRVVVLVLASGVAFVLALGAGVFDSNIGIAKAVKKCPPGSTYERPSASDPAACTMTKVGSPGNDVLSGSQNPRIIDKIYGKGGNDVLVGYGNRDELAGGNGNDTLYGGPGDDWLFGGSLAGGTGNDTLYGGPGDDWLHGDSGRNKDSGRDKIYGGPGDDQVYDLIGLYLGGGGLDMISTGLGDDYILSEDGALDIILCGPGKEYIAGDRIDYAKDCEEREQPGPG
jgi:Ca2+-binding RTX toxin-like protein